MSVAGHKRSLPLARSSPRRFEVLPHSEPLASTPNKWVEVRPFDPASTPGPAPDQVGRCKLLSNSAAVHMQRWEAVRAATVYGELGFASCASSLNVRATTGSTSHHSHCIILSVSSPQRMKAVAEWVWAHLYMAQPITFERPNGAFGWSFRPPTPAFIPASALSSKPRSMPPSKPRPTLLEQHIQTAKSASRASDVGFDMADMTDEMMAALDAAEAEHRQKTERAQQADTELHDLADVMLPADWDALVEADIAAGAASAAATRVEAPLKGLLDARTVRIDLGSQFAAMVPPDMRAQAKAIAEADARHAAIVSAREQARKQAQAREEAEDEDEADEDAEDEADEDAEDEAGAEAGAEAETDVDPLSVDPLQVLQEGAPKVRRAPMTDEQLATFFQVAAKPRSEWVTPEEVYAARVVLTQEQADEIESAPQGSAEWLAGRDGRLTASQFADTFGVGFQTADELLADKLHKLTSSNPAMAFGSLHEPDGRESFLAWFQREWLPARYRAAGADPAQAKCLLLEFGVIIFPERPQFGTSPDGVIVWIDPDGAICMAEVEFKCPFYLYKSPDHPYAKEPRNTPKKYQCQIQGVAGQLNDHTDPARPDWGWPRLLKRGLLRARDTDVPDAEAKLAARAEVVTQRRAALSRAQAVQAAARAEFAAKTEAAVDTSAQEEAVRVATALVMEAVEAYAAAIYVHAQAVRILARAVEAVPVAVHLLGQLADATVRVKWFIELIFFVVWQARQLWVTEWDFDAAFWRDELLPAMTAWYGRYLQAMADKQNGRLAFGDIVPQNSIDVDVARAAHEDEAAAVLAEWQASSGGGGCGGRDCDDEPRAKRARISAGAGAGDFDSND